VNKNKNMKNKFNFFGKIFKISLITFLITYVISGLIPILIPIENATYAFNKINIFSSLFIYLFIYLFWIFILTAFVYTKILLKFKPQKVVRYIFAVILSLMIALLCFNFGHIIDKDYSRIILWSPYIYFLFTITGLALAFLTERYFKTEL